MKSDTVLERLRRLHPRRIDLALDRLQRLLDALGNPEKKLPPVIHVAGTNGKGSVVAFLRAIYEAAGYKPQVYTSPHLVRFHERIRLSAGVITELELVKVFEEAEEANKGEPITEFEITTAAAFLAFSRDPADVCLLEVGLGGRFDATNVIDKPAASVITPVSLDHADWFGAEIAGIAFEKAGIIKAGVPLVMASQVPEARTVIRTRARELGAPVLEQGPDFAGEPSAEGGFVYRDKQDEFVLPPPSLMGAHQIGNAAVAIAAARVVPGFKLTKESFAAGVRQPSRQAPAKGSRALARRRPQCRRGGSHFQGSPNLAQTRAGTPGHSRHGHAEDQGSSGLPLGLPGVGDETLWRHDQRRGGQPPGRRYRCGSEIIGDSRRGFRRHRSRARSHRGWGGGR